MGYNRYCSLNREIDTKDEHRFINFKAEMTGGRVMMINILYVSRTTCIIQIIKDWI